MSKAERVYEDLIVWQQARALARDIYHITQGKPFSEDHVLREELRNAVDRIVINIMKGAEQGSQIEFARYLMEAHSACALLSSTLQLATDLGFVSDDRYRRIMRQMITTNNTLNKLKDQVSRA
ncbi:MAG: four helix bundle protein [Anaerolineae bacterium]|nr:four helix bundle protein [Anaerolineae bacterium]